MKPNLAAAALLCLGCNEPTLVPVELPADEQTQGCQARDGETDHRSTCVSLRFSNKVDLLFVVDAHASAFAWQRSLADAMPRLAESLGSSAQHPDLHIGIVPAQRLDGGCSSSPSGRGSGGQFSATSCLGRPTAFSSSLSFEACQARCNRRFDESGPWLSIPADQSAPSIDALTERLQCTALVGDRGCETAEHFGSLLAVMQRREDDGRFFRDDATPIIVIVSGSDDCTATFDPGISATDLDRAACWSIGSDCVEVAPSSWECVPSDSEALFSLHTMVDHLEALASWTQYHTGNRAHLAVWAGWSDPQLPLPARPPRTPEDPVAPTCVETGSEALPPTRLALLADCLNPSLVDVSTTSVCAGDLDTAMDGLIDAIGRAIPRGCIPMCLADTDVDEPGVQADCGFEAVWVEGAERRRLSLLPCDSAENPPPGDAPGCFTLRTGDSVHPDCALEGWNGQVGLHWNGPLPDGLWVTPRCRISDDCPVVP